VQKPPEGYQTAEWQLTRGQIDQGVARRDMPATIASILTLLGYGPQAPVAGTVETTDTEVGVG